MNRTLLLGLAGLLTVGACTKRDTLDPSSYEPLSLVDPAPGQVQRFERIHLGASDTTAQSYRDTLIVEVTHVDAQGITVRETLSPHSASYLGDAAAVAFPFDTLTYQLSPKPTHTAVKAAGEGAFRSRLCMHHNDSAPSLSYALTGAQGATLRGDRVDTPYLPEDRAYTLADGSGAAVLLHGARDKGLPGLTYVHDSRTGVRLALREYDFDGNAEGWRRIQ